ncbi:MAG: hypothetical protein AAB599_01865 [Patescibacteria group bacterium]
MQKPQSNLVKDVLLPSLVILVVILAGVGTGWKISGSKNILGRNDTFTAGDLKKGEEVGSSDTKTFKDEAEGTIEAGGVNGEGTHKLLRVGGASQTAALTSSVIDLDEFVGEKVHVWGETFSSTKAAWLMDVGKIKIVE